MNKIGLSIPPILLETNVPPGKLSHIKSHTTVKCKSKIHMCDADVCPTRTRTSKPAKSPVVCLLCNSTSGTRRFSASVENILMLGDVKLNPSKLLHENINCRQEDLR